MAHQRIWKFNTKDTYSEQKLDNDLCQVVVAKGTMVFVRGRIGQDLETSKSVGVGDVAAQTEQAMKNIKMLLTEAGSSLQHICKIMIYIIALRVDWSDADPIADLERLWAFYEPQLEAYVTRAIDPSFASSFGVPGDE